MNLEGPRESELTQVLGREVFDVPPSGVETEAELARWRAFREAYHRAQKLDGPSDFPLQLDFELNSTCQMKCSHCVHGLGEPVKKRELSFEAFARVVDEGAEHGLCSVKLNYINEPLLRRDLPRFVRYARSRGVMNVYFATNGLLLTQATARELIDAGLSKVMVSLDATTPGTFSLMRRSTKLPEIEANVRGLIALRDELGAAGPLVRVNFLRTAANASEADEFVRRWTGVADAVGFQRQVRMPGVDDDLLGFGEDAETFRCSFPFKLLVIDSAGDILPCCTFSGRELPIGNVATMTIAEAWQSAGLRRLKQLHAEGRGLTESVCAHCVGCA